MSDLDVAAIREASERLGFSDTDGSSRRQRVSSRSAMLFQYVDGDGETHRMRLDPSKDPSDPGWLTEIEQDAREFDDELPATGLNGNGQRYDDCGVELPVVLCDDCLDRTWADRTCRRAACPRCHKSHEFHGTKTDASKIEALRRKRNAKNGTHGTAGDLIHHGVASFLPSFAVDSSTPLKRGKEILSELLIACNIDTSEIFYHPYRIKKAYRGDVNGHASGDGDMTWKDILAKLDSEEWTEEAVIDEFLVFAPHFHFIALTPNFEGGVITEKIHDATGIVIHRITKSGKNDNVSIFGINDLCRAIAYCRTHTGLRRNEETEEFQTATWRSGEVANLDASKGVEAEIDQALRDVAHDVLGVDFQRADACQQKVPVGSDDDESAAESPSVPSDWSPDCSPVSVAGPADDRALGPSGGSLDLDDKLMADGGSTWEATAGVVPDFADEPMTDDVGRENVETERCGGDFVPMKYAPMYFTDDDLAEEMPDRVEGLKMDYEIWQSGGRKPPD